MSWVLWWARHCKKSEKLEPLDHKQTHKWPEYKQRTANQRIYARRFEVSECRQPRPFFDLRRMRSGTRPISPTFLAP
ncbi:MAG: hypothetical protein GY820_30030 [Gammaproteobacteria bacterium]|nr:hypothetical protein [Gammaproteobacteria bacterium]